MKKNITIISLILLLLIVVGCSNAGEKIQLPDTDRAGNAIEIPEKIEKIISLAPSTTEILEALGQKDKLIAVDNQSPFSVDGLDELPQFDMMAPDLEALGALNPDVIYVTGMSNVGGEDPFQPLRDLGVSVIAIPSSTSIKSIQEDIQFVADTLKVSEEGKKINDDLQAGIDQIAKIGETITDKKTVLFEIAALPDIYSFGKNTFLHEMIELIGATNILEDQDSWVALNEEVAISKNPDVILTNVNYLEDPIGEILGRQGWEKVSAIENKEVYGIDNVSSSLPNHNILKALKEMALAVYPEEFKELKE